jgi:hypothetical protein
MRNGGNEQGWSDMTIWRLNVRYSGDRGRVHVQEEGLVSYMDRFV